MAELPKCPRCGRTDYRLEYDRKGQRTGWRICLFQRRGQQACGNRWRP